MAWLMYDGPEPHVMIGGERWARGQIRQWPADRRLLQTVPGLRRMVPVSAEPPGLFEDLPADWRAVDKLTVRLPKELIARVKGYARRERVPVQAVIRAFLDHGLASFGQPEGSEG